MTTPVATAQVVNPGAGTTGSSSTAAPTSFSAFTGSQSATSTATIQDVGRSAVDPSAMPILQAANYSNYATGADIAHTEEIDGSAPNQAGSISYPDQVTAADIIKSYESGTANGGKYAFNEPHAIKLLQLQLNAAGYLDPSSGQPIDATGIMDGKTANALANLLNDASENATPNGQTWSDYLQSKAQAKLTEMGVDVSTPDKFGLWLSNSLSGTPSGMGLTNRVSTTSQDSSKVTITSAPDARAIFTSAMQANTGRGPTEKEIAAFTSALQQYQRANPATTHSESKTVGTYDRSNPYIPLHSSTTGKDTTGDRSQISPADLAQNMARSGQLGQEANTYAVGAQYYNAAIAALGAGGTGGAETIKASLPSAGNG